MTRRFTGLDPERVRSSLERVREAIAAAGRDPDEVEVCAAVKYVAAEELPALASAGIRLVGENRAQDLVAKHGLHGRLFEWDFIGALQSRKVRDLAPVVRIIQSVASDSALAQLARHPVPEILVQVNVAGEQGKAGLAPADVAAFVERSPVRVIGLMTMPPFASDPEASRPHFAALRALADSLGLHHCSMGTSQDYLAAAQEGATIVRVGGILLS